MQKYLLAFLMAAMIGSASSSAQTSTWVPDKAHSSISFSVLHLGLSKVRGKIGNVGGVVDIESADITKSTVRVTIDLSTVDTGEPARDSDLKSKNFFDIEHYPTATFVSTKVSRRGDELEVIGDLTLHGVTKPVTLHIEGPTGPVTGGDKKPHSGFSASTVVDRTNFGIGPSYPAAIVGNEVTLAIDLDVAKQ